VSGIKLEKVPGGNSCLFLRLGMTPGGFIKRNSDILRMSTSVAFLIPFRTVYTGISRNVYRKK
jgi:hypothetical protein